MASQKLEFLKKIDPAEVAAAMKAAGRTPASAASAATTPEKASGPPSDGPPTSAEVFGVIGDFIAKHSELVGQTGAVFQFKLKDPESAWVIDLKTGAGSVARGTASGADVTLDMTDADFLDMTSGKADAQKLYFGGKLKISGNVMASQKLMFLKKIDQGEAAAFVAKARASGGGAGAAAVAAVTVQSLPARPAVASAVFEALAARIAANPGLVAEVQALVAVRVTDPDGAWVVDLKAPPGGVRQGLEPGAGATLRLSDEDLEALVRGGDARELHQRGRMRVDGDVRVAHRLGFFKGLL
jgi:3-hydroxyacyl-CoA dehydrogenase/3a,7a,12a-trihydroxy-5b-cholest-24-enoyl-CoA hydratase